MRNFTRFGNTGARYSQSLLQRPFGMTLSDLISPFPFPTFPTVSSCCLSLLFLSVRSPSILSFPFVSFFPFTFFILFSFQQHNHHYSYCTTRTRLCFFFDDPHRAMPYSLHKPRKSQLFPKSDAIGRAPKRAGMSTLRDQPAKCVHRIASSRNGSYPSQTANDRVITHKTKCSNNAKKARKKKLPDDFTRLTPPLITAAYHEKASAALQDTRDLASCGSNPYSMQRLARGGPKYFSSRSEKKKARGPE